MIIPLNQGIDNIGKTGDPLDDQKRKYQLAMFYPEHFVPQVDYDHVEQEEVEHRRHPYLQPKVFVRRQQKHLATAKPK